MEEPVKEKKKKKSKSEKTLGEVQKSESFQLEASTKQTKLDTSKWPLLLKVSYFNQFIDYYPKLTRIILFVIVF